MAKYKQPALTIDAQIEELKKKGLSIENEEILRFHLSHISYFRLKHYTYNFKDVETGRFVPSTTFDQVFELYSFDRKLRLILFDAIETIEVAIKTLISNIMSVNYGTHWYLEQKYFSASFGHNELINKVKGDFLEQEETSMISYKRLYDELPPSWMVMEFLTIGRISIIFEHLTVRNEKLEICNHFGLPENVLITWFHTFTVLRNRCAHHSRLVYRSIKAPILPARKKHIFLKEVDYINRNSLYCGLCCLQYLVSKINPECSFKDNLKHLIKNSKSISIENMGFTENWEEETIWQ